MPFRKPNRKAGEISNPCANIRRWKDMHTDVNRVTLSGWFMCDLKI